MRPAAGELTVFLDPSAAAVLVSDQFIGIDVGGTKIACATLQAGELSESHLQHTELGSQEGLVGQLIARDRGTRARRRRARSGSASRR